MSVFEQKISAALDVAAKNNHTLTRLPDGKWRGAPEDKLRFTADVIAALVKSNQACYTRFKDGTSAGIEVKTDLPSIYAKYEIS